MKRMKKILLALLVMALLLNLAAELVSRRCGREKTNE